MAKSQLDAGMPQHAVSRWLQAKSLEWQKGLGSDFEWQLGLAQHTGGSLKQAIDAWILQHRHAQQVSQEKSVALQGPKLTARLIHLVPWLALLVAQWFDLNPFGFLFGNPLGWGLLIISLALSWLAARWTTRIVGTFEGAPVSDPGSPYASLALMVRSGLGVGSGLRLLRSHGVEIPDSLPRILQVQTKVGAGLTAVLLTQAEWERGRIRLEQRRELAKLPVRLLYPMALLLLPQFMLLTVTPIAIGAMTTA